MTRMSMRDYQVKFWLDYAIFGKRHGSLKLQAQPKPRSTRQPVKTNDRGWGTEIKSPAAGELILSRDLLQVLESKK